MNHIVFRNERGAVVGTFENGWLVKRHVDPIKHKLMNYNAFATDAEHIYLLRHLNGKGVRLEFKDGRVIEADVASFNEHGFEIGQGHGRQIALSLRWWRDVASDHTLMLPGLGG